MDRRVLFALALVVTVSAQGCHHDPTDAAGVRANLAQNGYTLGASSRPDPRAAPYADVRASECFDATSGETVQVCVWVWSGGALPDSFPLETFTQASDAYTESRSGVLVVVSPTGGPGASTPGFRAIRSVWGD